jgi:hypothetical protein
MPRQEARQLTVGATIHVVADRRVDGSRRRRATEIEQLVIADNVDQLLDAERLIVDGAESSKNGHETSIASILRGEITPQSITGYKFPDGWARCIKV